MLTFRFSFLRTHQQLKFFVQSRDGVEHSRPRVDLACTRGQPIPAASMPRSSTDSSLRRSAGRRPKSQDLPQPKPGFRSSIPEPPITTSCCETLFKGGPLRASRVDVKIPTTDSRLKPSCGTTLPIKPMAITFQAQLQEPRTQEDHGAGEPVPPFPPASPERPPVELLPPAPALDDVGDPPADVDPEIYNWMDETPQDDTVIFN
ncbi:hypothetical protein JTE90_012392 [Oedothorax gibbosus]|uniref:Uncharacterized protein n=1 Tax=Oedothorax gibbosus TaxID=931172 RepID=A0AAV6TXW5_9ARAC|nr:hypothetical protein JTE90_012392 [Oedothorax gibbosus]